MQGPPQRDTISAALAVSMTEPPPTETTPSTRASERKRAPRSALASSGSIRMSANTTLSTPDADSDSRARATSGPSASTGSVNSATRFSARAAARAPSSPSAPRPKLSFGIATVKVSAPPSVGAKY